MKKLYMHKWRIIALRILAISAVVGLLLTTIFFHQPQGAQAALNARTSWVGNTFAGSTFVQMDIEDIFVAPDGTVYTDVPWEEGGREMGMYKDGNTLGQFPDTSGNLGGTTVTANGTYVFGAAQSDASFRRYTIADRSVTSIPGGTGDGSYKAVGNEGTITGMAARNTELYVSDSSNNQIHVYNTDSVEQLRSFSVSRPRELAVDSDGNLWIIQAGDSSNGPKVLRYSASGSKLAQEISFPEGVNPTDIAIDNDNRILITDNGPKQQVRIYTNITATPTLDSTFGDTGGVFSGTPGKIEPLKFQGLIGVGTDSAGNIYVGMHGFGTNGSGTVLESYTSSGTRNWTLRGLEFVDGADADPGSDAQDIYTDHEHFSMDFSKPAGQEWSYTGYTLNPFKYPNDERLQAGGSDGVLARRVQGRTLLFMSNMNNAPFRIYRFHAATDGEIAIPSGSYSKHDDGSWGMWPDSDGNIWEATPGGGIYKTPLTGFDNDGVPLYGSAQSFPMPAPFTSLQRIEYFPASDTMYLAGYTSTYPNQGDWGRIGRAVVRYDNWSSSRTQSWEANITLPNTVGSNEAKSMSVAGDYLFVAGVDTRALVKVYRVSDGGLVGELAPSTAYSLQETGWIDIPFALRAYQRANGEYTVFLEDDGYAKIVLYRWCPSGSCTGAATPTPNSNAKTYEAESASNTLADGAFAEDCAACSGGKKVRWVGSVQFNAVNVPAAGSYNVSIAFLNGDASRTALISVNGGTGTSYTFGNSGGFDKVGTLNVTLNLQAGNNTIRIYAGGSAAPDFDAIRV